MARPNHREVLPDPHPHRTRLGVRRRNDMTVASFLAIARGLMIVMTNKKIEKKITKRHCINQTCAYLCAHKQTKDMGTIIYDTKKIVEKTKHESDKLRIYANSEAKVQYYLELRLAAVGYTNLTPIPKEMVCGDCEKVVQGIEHEAFIRVYPTSTYTGDYTRIAEAYTMLHIDSKTGEARYSISIEHESGRETYESNLTYEQATSKFLNWLKKYK